MGSMLSCLFAGLAMNNLGRKGSTLYFTVPFYFCGYFLIVLAESSVMIIVGRFVTGKF